MAWQRDTAYREGQQVAHWPQNQQEHESLGKLLGELAEQSANLVRDEVALVQQEMREKVKPIQSSAIAIAIGTLMGMVSILACSAALILLLARYIPAWQAALAVGLGMAIIGSIAISIGWSQFKRTKLKPEQTIETMEENKEWLKEIT